MSRISDTFIRPRDLQAHHFFPVNARRWWNIIPTPPALSSFLFSGQPMRAAEPNIICRLFDIKAACRFKDPNVSRCHLQYYWANTWLAWANYFAKNVMGKVRAWIGTSLILLLDRRAKFNSQRESRYFEYEFCKPEKHKLSTTGKQTLYETAWDADRRRNATCPSQASCRLHNNTITGWHLGILLREKKWSPAP